MRFLFIIIYLFQIVLMVQCKNKTEYVYRNRLPYFMRMSKKSEEPKRKDVDSDESKAQLVSLLVQNVKEIFGNNDETEIVTSTHSTCPREMSILSNGTSLTKSSIITYEEPINNNEIPMYPMIDNLSLAIHQEPKMFQWAINANELDTSENLLQMNKETKNLGNYEEKTSIASFVMQTTENFEALEKRRSCISCNNVDAVDCTDPKFKLIPAKVCDRESDVCYSQHTPFGIVDRGCFNVNHNLTTYVCSCNLCNYISISEMPFIFSSKQDWVDNVVELSRTRNFRNSVFKDMACLRCEASAIKRKGDTINDTQCFEGIIGSLPTIKCDDNELCAVKAIKSTGYIWRGCVKSPLYNYWWSKCDFDLCNYDKLVSIYDEI